MVIILFAVGKTRLQLRVKLKLNLNFSLDSHTPQGAQISQRHSINQAHSRRVQKKQSRVPGPWVPPVPPPCPAPLGTAANVFGVQAISIQFVRGDGEGGVWSVGCGANTRSHK